MIKLFSPRNILIALLSCGLLFSAGRVLPKERVLAYIEIVQIEEGIYIRTSYDTRVFINECEPKMVVAKEFYKTCVDSTIDKRSKKLE